MNTCYVANGSADLYFEYGMHIWDMAASSLIATEAGCFVSEPKGGELNLLNRGILVSATKELAEQVFPLITPIANESD